MTDYRKLIELLEELIWKLKSESNVTCDIAKQQTNKFTEQSEYVPVTRTESKQ